MSALGRLIMKSISCIIRGQTTDGKMVLAGIFKFYETEGVPLDIFFQLMQERNAIPCWKSLYREAREAKMTHERIISMLDSAISDSFGPFFRDEVISTLEKLHLEKKLEV